jgi:hypothetical protein
MNYGVHKLNQAQENTLIYLYLVYMVIVQI